MSHLNGWFEEALTISDPVKRSQAMSDLAFDAQQMLLDGRRHEAVELFMLLTTLDRYDDLLHPAIQIADDNLIMLGVRDPSPLEEVVAELHQRFGHQPERERFLAIATTLVREHGSRGAASRAVATELLARAETIRALTGKELRLRAEIIQRTQRDV